MHIIKIKMKSVVLNEKFSEKMLCIFIQKAISIGGKWKLNTVEKDPKGRKNAERNQE